MQEQKEKVRFMKKTKKLLTAWIAAVVSFSLAACGGNAGSGNGQQSAAEEATEPPARAVYDLRAQIELGQTAGTMDIGQSHVVALFADGTVDAVGDHTYGQCDVRNWENVIQVSAGAYHTLGLCSGGTVVATGNNGSGQCDVYAWSQIMDISAGGTHSVAARSDGTVVATGVNEDGQCDVSGWTDVVQVSAGFQHTVGLRSDGTVLATGLNKGGQCDVSDWTDIEMISAAGNITVGLKKDGSVVTTGSFDVVEGVHIDQWTDVVRIDAASSSVAGLRSDGTMLWCGVSMGADTEYAEEVWNDLVSVHVCHGATVGLRYDGTVLVSKGHEVDESIELAQQWSNIQVIAENGSLIGEPDAATQRPRYIPERPSEDQLSGSGQCGDALNWAYYNNGALYISGQGAMWDFEDGEVPWEAWLEVTQDLTYQMTHVYVEEGVTSIGSFAFAVGNHSSLRNVSLPDTLEHIGQRAFLNCDLMRSCPIPDGVKTIGDYAFKGCELFGAVLPASLQELGNSAFSYSGIRIATIPGTVKVVPDSAFSDCEHLQVVELGEGVEKLENGAFSFCDILEKVTVPESLTEVEMGVFYSCDLLPDLGL